MQTLAAASPFQRSLERGLSTTVMARGRAEQGLCPVPAPSLSARALSRTRGPGELLLGRARRRCLQGPARLSLTLEIASSPAWGERAPHPSPPGAWLGLLPVADGDFQEGREKSTPLKSVCMSERRTWKLKKNQEMLWVNVKGGFPDGFLVKNSPAMQETQIWSPGEGKDSPLQYSCLENPMDRGAQWATVHEVAKSWTRLSDWTKTM